METVYDDARRWARRRSTRVLRRTVQRVTRTPSPTERDKARCAAASAQLRVRALRPVPRRGWRGLFRSPRPTW